MNIYAVSYSWLNWELNFDYEFVGICSSNTIKCHKMHKLGKLHKIHENNKLLCENRIFAEYLCSNCKIRFTEEFYNFQTKNKNPTFTCNKKNLT